MRLAIVDQVGGTGGIARFMRSLAWGLLRLPELTDARFDVVLHGPISGTTYSWPAELADRRLRVHTMPAMEPSRHPLARARRRANRIMRPRSPLELAARRLAWVERFLEDAQPDVAIFTSPFGMPVPRWPGRKLVAVHDCNHRRFETWPPMWRDQIDRDLPGWLAQATVVVPSRFSAAELQLFYGADPAALTVIPYGVHPAAPPVPVARRLPPEFLLDVAVVAPHKDPLTALRAFAALGDRRRGLALVFAGDQSDLEAPAPHSHAAAVAAEVERLGLQLSADVIGLGTVSDANLEWLFENASGLVAPTLYEGGALPILEAIRSGCPVACSGIPTLVEQVPDQPGVHWFDPGDVEGCTTAVTRMLGGPRPAGGWVLERFDRLEAARAYLKLIRIGAP